MRYRSRAGLVLSPGLSNAGNDIKMRQTMLCFTALQPSSGFLAVVATCHGICVASVARLRPVGCSLDEAHVAFKQASTAVAAV